MLVPSERRSQLYRIKRAISETCKATIICVHEFERISFKPGVSRMLTVVLVGGASACQGGANTVGRRVSDGLSKLIKQLAFFILAKTTCARNSIESFTGKSGRSGDGN